ncbi:hypothetical protein NE237_001018 [Protea cynaroides]|uniref:Uncharacterized protein n=1 Tax=Protea cynaroides TaxID=273540 RepID=A0A9Q0QY07_9MAGN|nr:hypothetical protein NE237_001018 [Protea cynaroides]
MYVEAELVMVENRFDRQGLMVELQAEGSMVGGICRWTGCKRKLQGRSCRRKLLWQVWKMRTGSRLLTIHCPKGSRILQPTHRFGSSSASASSYVPLEVFLLNGDSGQLSVLNRSLN